MSNSAQATTASNVELRRFFPAPGEEYNSVCANLARAMPGAQRELIAQRFEQQRATLLASDRWSIQNRGGFKT
jgi:hypothetical protein